MDLKAILYDWNGADIAIFHAINNITTPLFVRCMLIGSSLGKYTIFPLYLMIIFAVALIVIRNARIHHSPNALSVTIRWAKTLGTLLLAYGLMLVWVSFLKNLLHVPRPFAALPQGTFHVLDIIKASETPMTSFPSGHCAFVITLVASLWPVLNPFWKGVGIFYILWVAISRVALAAHFPADVVWTCVFAYFAVKVASFVMRRMVSLNMWQKLG